VRRGEGGYENERGHRLGIDSKRDQHVQNVFMNVQMLRKVKKQDDDHSILWVD